MDLTATVFPTYHPTLSLLDRLLRLCRIEWISRKRWANCPHSAQRAQRRKQRWWRQRQKSEPHWIPFLSHTHFNPPHFSHPALHPFVPLSNSRHSHTTRHSRFPTGATSSPLCHTHALRRALGLVGLQVLDTDPRELNHDGLERSRSGGRSASRTRRCRGRRPPCRKDDDQSRGEARTEAFDQWILWQDARGGCGRGHGKAAHRRRRRRRTDGTGTHFSHMSHAPFPHISEIEFFFRPPLSPRSSPRHQRRQLEDRNRRSSSRRCQR